MIETVPLHFKSFIKKGQNPIDFRIETMKRILDKLHVDFHEANVESEIQQSAKNRRLETVSASRTARGASKPKLGYNRPTSKISNITIATPEKLNIKANLYERGESLVKEPEINTENYS